MAESLWKKTLEKDTNPGYAWSKGPLSTNSYRQGIAKIAKVIANLEYLDDQERKKKEERRTERKIEKRKKEGKKRKQKERRKDN